MINTLYEDDNCLFINKPAGISVHGDGKTPEKTLADFLIEKYPEIKDVGEPMNISFKGKDISIPKPGIVHRLDKETSGVMLIAKNQDSYLFFKKQFQEREIKKIYHCFVYGWIRENKQIVSGMMGRDSGDIRKWTMGKNVRGTLRESVTEIEVLKRFGEGEYKEAEFIGKGNTKEGVYSFVEARPKTGRTHQIRVHLRSINHPIVTDSLYAPNREEALGFERLALHARSLEVILPGGEIQKIIAPYPEDFENALKLAE